jgi:exopolyphosphatase/guanosine-5'-triphosphate,3'-diphosphate pyrophosphatase
VPIRLGLDGFLKNKIKTENRNRLNDAMNAFKLLMKIHDVSKYKICATSAMREATNSKDVINDIYFNTGLQIDIISGKDEASLIADTFFANNFNFNETYLFIDIGGGSTELSIIFNGVIIASKSFKLGTIRFLNDLVKKKSWSDYKKWIKSNTKEFNNIIIIGSGGNINKLLKESKKDINQSISYSFIEKFYKKISNLSFEERITKLGFNPDRSDVIVPATKLLIKSMQYAKSKEVIVPRIGLADGIIRKLNNVDSFGDDLNNLNT